MDNKDKLNALALAISKIVSQDQLKNDKYIAFLKKHGLPNSGPTVELLNSLTKDQRTELIGFIK